MRKQSIVQGDTGMPGQKGLHNLVDTESFSSVEAEEPDQIMGGSCTGQAPFVEPSAR